MIDQFRKLMEPLQRRVMLSIGRAVLNAVSDGNKSQLVQASLLEDETRDKMERLAEYGFTSVPLPGAQAVAVFVGGERGHGIIIATGDHRYRLSGLAGGEVALYTDEGDKIVLKRGNLIEMETKNFVVKASEGIRFETPKVESTGTIKDLADSGGRTMDSMRQVFDTHTHPGDSGGTTNVPNQKMQ